MSAFKKAFCKECGGIIAPPEVVVLEGFSVSGWRARGGCCCSLTEELPMVRGCTDPDALNYNPAAVVEDGTCIFGALVGGCTNPIAQNFDPFAQTDDGSCIIFPHAVFTYFVTDYSVDFDAGLSTDDGTIVAYDWTFGDGTTGAGIAPTHVYGISQNYVVTLTVTDNDGLTNSTSQVVPITQNQFPVAAFSWTATYLSVAFNGSTSSDIDGTVVDWQWNFGDGAIGSGETATHVYAVAGDYTVTLTVTDNGGFTDFIQQTVTVLANVLPVAAFTYIPTNLVVDFDATTSSDSDGTIVSWAWDFGNGNTDAGETTSHTFAAAGTYLVTLTVTDNAGGTDSEQQSITLSDVMSPPVAAFTWACTPTTTDIYIGFDVTIDSSELVGTYTADFIDLFSGADYFNFYLDITADAGAGAWNLFGVTNNAAVITIPPVAGTVHNVLIHLQSDGIIVTTTLSVDGQVDSFTENYRYTINEIRFGAFQSGSVNNHSLDNLIVGTTLGGTDIFTADFASSIVPPFDSIVGSGISIVGGALNVNNGGTDAYAVKAITPISL